MTILRSLVVAGLLGLAALPACAAEKLKPFVLASTTTGEPAAVAKDIAAKLSAAGFQIAGQYSPYPAAVVLVVTNDALKSAAAQGSLGGYGAGQRIAVTKLGGEVQVSYTDPRYMAAAYRLPGDGAEPARQLAAVLGAGAPYGADSGLTAAELRDYHYMIGMEYFTDPHVLAEYPDQAAALAAVEKGLAESRSGVTKVYRIDLPGKAESVFGVALKGAQGSGDQQDDRYIMEQIDFKSTRSTAHLPYDMLVSNGKVYALSARFRIAINFPDLSMMGSNSFMSIMGCPDAIQKALMTAAGGKAKSQQAPPASQN